MAHPAVSSVSATTNSGDPDPITIQVLSGPATLQLAERSP